MRIEPARRLEGVLEPPPDKSISHRAALLAAMSEGRVRIENYLAAGDSESTLAAVEALGAEVVERTEHERSMDLVLAGVGLRGPGEREKIDVGNAGTLLRILPGWLAGQGRGRWTLDGDASIRRRPVDRVAEPLRAMGARVKCRRGRLPPLTIEGAELQGIRYELPVASAQVKSCVLLAGLLADGDTTVLEPLPSRDHTERMLEAAGATIHRRGAGRGKQAGVTVQPAGGLSLDTVVVPGDFSSAAFFLTAAALLPGSDLTLRAVGVNPTRTGLLAVLARMGASVETAREREVGGEPVADVTVRASTLKATSVTHAEVPLAIDELPLVALLGVFAEGTTTVSGAEELRHKESDRVATVVAGLRGLGAEIEATGDGFVVEGSGALRGGTLDAGGDHRLAMLGAVAALVSETGVEVRGFAAASVSYPGFLPDLRSVVHM